MKTVQSETTDAEITDLHLASYLSAVGFTVSNMTFGPNGRVTFHFKNVPREVVLAYYRGEDSTSARKLFDSFKALKSVTIQRF